MLSDYQSAWIQQRGVSQKSEDLLIFMRSGVGRIEKDDIECGRIGAFFSGKFLQAAKSVDGKYTRAGTNFE